MLSFCPGSLLVFHYILRDLRQNLIPHGYISWQRTTSPGDTRRIGSSSSLRVLQHVVNKVPQKGRQYHDRNDVIFISLSYTTSPYSSPLWPEYKRSAVKGCSVCNSLLFNVSLQVAGTIPGRARIRTQEHFLLYNRYEVVATCGPLIERSSTTSWALLYGTETRQDEPSVRCTTQGEIIKMYNI